MQSRPSKDDAGSRIAIIGAGFSGLCAAIRLKLAGFDNFSVFEKGDEVGGTWRENTYPGAACDVFWHLYSFSFEHRTGFTCPYPEQPEILGYQKFCATKYGIYPHVRFNTEVVAATYDDASAQWRIDCRDGKAETFDAVITGVGQLNRPAWPNLPGMDEFRGHSFHSALWDHDCDLTGKNIAVVGTGASAIQFVPRIAPKAGHLDVFQRSAPYLLPRFQRKYGPINKWLFRTFPRYRDIFRYSIFGLAEIIAVAFHGQSKVASILKWITRIHLNRQIKDPELRGKLTPNYPIGCKRVLFSSDYYPALGRDNVKLVDAAISRVTPTGVVTTDGDAYDADVIIYGTGFKATEFLAPIKVYGSNGKALAERWANGAEAYKGITVDGFPNLFMCYGPNTNLGGNSIIYMIECQVNYILDCLQKLQHSNANTMDVKPRVITAYNRDLDDQLDDTVWKKGCRSWYINTDGRVTNNWPGTNTQYRRITRSADLADYQLGN